MIICSYLVVASPGAASSLARQLGALPGCEVVPAVNRDVLLLVTESQDAERDDALRSRIAALEEVSALVLTFGNLTPPDTMLDAPDGHRGLPVLRPGPCA